MKGILATLLLALAGQFAQADGKYGMAGCGLGSLAFGDDNGKFMQILAATSNNLGYNQAFGITSGSSNCLNAGQMAQVNAQEKFFASNLQVLSKEMAQGQGEYVKALAQTMGCKNEVHGAFATEMQKSYSEIFSAPGAGAMLGRVRSSIHSNQELNANCDTVI